MRTSKNNDPMLLGWVPALFKGKFTDIEYSTFMFRVVKKELNWIFDEKCIRKRMYNNFLDDEILR